MPKNATTAVEREQRRRKVAQLLLNHRTQREIATALGCGLATVNRDVNLIHDEWRKQYARDYGERVAEELAKLDLMERAMMPKVMEGSGWAVDRMLGLMNHRARLLGLYAPEKHEVVTVDALEQELQRLNEALADNDPVSTT